jgi:biopolymer transport protein ExbD
MADINTTPLVDVMLVLLVIFMIALPTLSQRLPLDLPQPGPRSDTHPLKLLIEAGDT